MYQERCELILRAIRKETQDTSRAADMVIAIAREFVEFDGLIKGFPMLWTMLDFGDDKSTVADGFVYFMTSNSDSTTKIGISVDTKRRKKQNERNGGVKFESFLELKGCLGDEKEIHRLFSGEHLNGEWYENSENLLYYIDFMSKKKSVNKFLSASEAIDMIKWDMFFFGAERRIINDLISFGVGLKLQ